MDTRYGMAMVIGICVLVLIIGMLRRRAEIILNFFVRMILGVFIILFVNGLLDNIGVQAAVGMNAVSVLTVGILGTGGVGLLYGIVLYHLL